MEWVTLPSCVVTVPILSKDAQLSSVSSWSARDNEAKEELDHFYCKVNHKLEYRELTLKRILLLH
jgi:hypothetical protein